MYQKLRQYQQRLPKSIRIKSRGSIPEVFCEPILIAQSRIMHCDFDSAAIAEYPGDQGMDLVFNIMYVGNVPLLEYLKATKTRLARDKKFTVNCQRRDGSTGLYIAIEQGHYDAVVWCLANGGVPSVNLFKDRGNTPLMVAFQRNSIPLVRILIQHGAKETINSFASLVGIDGKTTTYDDQNVLHSASGGHVTVHNPELVRILIHEGGADPNMVDLKNSGLSPLGYACKRGYIKIADILLDAGADIHAIETGNGQSLTHLVCVAPSTRSHSQWQIKDHKTTEMLNWLHKNGAEDMSCKPSLRTSESMNKTPMFMASQCNNIEALKWFYKNGGKNEINRRAPPVVKDPKAMPCASVLRRSRQVSEPYMDSKGKEGYYGMKWQDFQLVNEILNNDALNDPNYSMKPGMSPMDVAVASGHKRIVKQLQKWGVPLPKETMNLGADYISSMKLDQGQINKCIDSVNAKQGCGQCSSTRIGSNGRVKKLKLCSGCKMVAYCSKQCMYNVKLLMII